MSLARPHIALFASILWGLAACGDPGGEGEVQSMSASIVGGWAATTEQIFATVEIRRAGASSGFCSGAVISPRLVITAAHCAVTEAQIGAVRPVAAGSLEVVAGHLSRASIERSMVRTVVRAWIHDQYDHDFIMGRSRAGAGKGGIGSPNDVALLLLSSPYDDLPNAPMLREADAAELVGHGDLGYIAGYGIYDLDEDLSGALHISDAIIDIIGRKELLTSRPDPIGDSCYGDSGGPLYVPTDEGDFLVGLVSRGRSDVHRDCGDGGVYTRLSAYLPWIETTAGAHFAPHLPDGSSPVAFRPAGAEEYVVPQSTELDRLRSCRASRSSARSPWGSVIALLVWVPIVRRLSRIC